MTLTRYEEGHERAIADIVQGGFSVRSPWILDTMTDEDAEWRRGYRDAVLESRFARTLVVTRHPALVAHLIDLGLASKESAVTDRVTADTARERHLIGDLVETIPLRVAGAAMTVTEIPLRVPPYMRRATLTRAQVADWAGDPLTWLTWTVMEWEGIDGIHQSLRDDSLGVRVAGRLRGCF